MPRVFLEGFFGLDKFEISAERLPENSKSIIIGSIPYDSHILKYLAIQKIKTKIICLQHGGGSNYYDYTRSPKELSNKFLTWPRTKIQKTLKVLVLQKKNLITKVQKICFIFE